GRVLLTRRPGAAHRRQGPSLPDHPSGGRAVPHPRRRHPSRLDPGAAGRVDRAVAVGGQVPGPPPDPCRLRAFHAPGRPGHLSQGPGPAVDPGRRVPGRPHPGGGRRLRRTVDDPAAGGGRRRGLRAAGGLRGQGPGQRGVVPGRGLPVPGRAARRLRGHRRDRPRPHPARPSGAVARGQARPDRAPAGRHPRLLSSRHRPGGAAAGSPRRRLIHAGRDRRGAAALLAHRGPVGAARPPHGRPHRFSHRGPAARRSAAGV
ncbi:MAG: tRNA (adenine(58)-N(1))-methyltransferase, partial [uncultured Acidimicrobiales bacterium]